MSAAAIAYVGLGGNVGAAERTLPAAIAALSGLPDTRLVQASRLYRTAAWGREDQAAFVNAVAEVETGLDARALLEALLGIERRFGRERAADGSDRWGPRTLDLDLLLFGEQVIDESGLRVPHPHLHERAFVLVPLLEIAPGLRIPGRGPARAELAAMATDGVQAIG
jgi:2-amino-4-hydroxy-6-hydroxymethyldihydropteridine diphosphokinase